MLNCDPTNDPNGRFNSVEALATQIFSKLPELQGDEKTANPTGRPRSGAQPGSVPHPNGHTHEKSAALALTERLFSALLAAVEERNLGDSSATPQAGHRRDRPAQGGDVGYRAAYKRAQLPEGVEPLHGKAAGASEDVMMSSIRQMMEEQNQMLEEQKETVRANRVAEKRAMAREILPPLEPQDVFDPEDARPHRSTDPKLGLRARALRRLQKACRNDYLLAFSLSGWSTLSMMVFIDPAVSTALCFKSLLLLVIAYFMFMERMEEERTLQVASLQNR